MVLALFLMARRHGSPLRRLATGALHLVLVQILLGAAVIFAEAALFVAVLHQAVGVITFGVVTLLMWRCLPVAGAETSLERGEKGHGLALRGA
jgi:heme A synthase